MDDIGLLAFVGVSVVTLVLWFAPQLWMCMCGRSSDSPKRLQADGATAPPAETPPTVAPDSGPVGCCVPACLGCCLPLGNRRRCCGTSCCGTSCFGKTLAAAFESICILVTVYFALALVLFIAISVAKDSLTFANVKASACQAAACTRSDGASCCSYAVDPARFPGATAPTEVTFPTTDGTMHGWYLVNDSAPADPSRGWLTILYSHGSGANVAVNYRQERYSWLLSQGRVRMFVYDYPGYGKSEGAPSYEGTQRAAIGAVAWLQERTNMTTDTNITYLGRSLGGNVAIDAIARSGSRSTRLVLQSTFASWASNFEALMPFLGWAMAPGFGDEFNAKPQAEQWSRRAGACVHLSHSKTDEWVPFSQAEALWKDIRPASDPSGCTSTFLVEDGPKHDDALTPEAKASLGAWLSAARF